jgi:hypothetical protein
MLSHINLRDYYTVIFSLAQHHKYQISEIENLLPYERDLYMDMLLMYLEELKEKQKK